MIWHLSVHGILPIDQPAAPMDPAERGAGVTGWWVDQRSEPVGRLETPIVREARISAFGRASPSNAQMERVMGGLEWSR